MKMYSFLGETPTKALQKAQEECGPDAVVISTKKIASAKDNKVNTYEITVALEDNVAKPKIPAKKVVYKDNGTTNSTNFYDVKAQIEEMQKSLGIVQKTLWEPKSKLKDLNIPPEFVEIYTLFQDNDFDEEMTYSIMKKTIEQLPVMMKSNPQKIKNFFKLI